MDTVSSTLARATRLMKDAGLADSPSLDARLLLCAVMDVSQEQLLARWHTEVPEEASQRFAAMLSARLAATPMAYILGWREFYGRRFHVDERVLIPRPDTETLIEAALAWIQEHSLEAPDIADICTGSGAVGITLALELPSSRVALTDISASALEVATENAMRLGAGNIRLYQGDVTEPVASESFDIVVSNPPYLTPHWYSHVEAQVLKEPRLALVGGDDGLTIIRRLVVGARSVLAPEGALFLECDWRQCDEVARIMERCGFAQTWIYNDLAGRPRVVRGNGICMNN
ncbi:peptide chain release factor N(5)-glutamine methyltransferase [Parasphaerochaeta coccoides]|uniref:Release factor glutamine methyltransferase n=1 Tax=Parasphaerochaeta coccoides (strain ATCC BAA-1237 / DSM 17374 / SPN1) TaxID=760011 RepID=F4GKA0_PARC1|nr:peptide chain release factor N(5)-glutamine methyltransferase [Parasphaerochaeta coccoides]AEC02296.1 protein-(glutamine-N5) methyltransferase, release factor-specific [Parasphaerochaeta coccoides DSM 17374]